MAFGRKTGKGQLLAVLANFEFSGTEGYISFITHIIHVQDGWVIIYKEENPETSYREERTCYVEASTGAVKWDQINKAQR